MAFEAALRSAWRKPSQELSYRRVDTGSTYRCVEILFGGKYVGEVFVGRSGSYYLMVWGRETIRVGNRPLLIKLLDSIFKNPRN